MTTRHLLDLPEDDVTAILCKCSRSSLGALSCCARQLCALVASELPWRTALERDYDLPSSYTSGTRDAFRESGPTCGVAQHPSARDVYRELTTAEPPEIAVAGVLTDGGIDQAVLEAHEQPARPPVVEEGCWQVWRVDGVRPFWVSNVFQPDDRCFSSDVQPDGSAASNVLIVGRILSRVSSSAVQRRREEADRRRFLVERLSFVLQAIPAALNHDGRWVPIDGLRRRFIAVAWHRLRHLSILRAAGVLPHGGRRLRRHRVGWGRAARSGPSQPEDPFAIYEPLGAPCVQAFDTPF